MMLASLPTRELVQLSTYFRECHVGVHVLDPVQLLQLARQVPVHDFHLGLQPVATQQDTSMQ
jgi:hypothetical protein